VGGREGGKEGGRLHKLVSTRAFPILFDQSPADNVPKTEARCVLPPSSFVVLVMVSTTGVNESVHAGQMPRRGGMEGREVREVRKRNRTEQGGGGMLTIPLGFHVHALSL